MLIILGYLRYWRKYDSWPSRMQRLYMCGDPTGEVRRFSDQILEELASEDT